MWLIRLVGATLYTFGLQRGVGLDTLSAFFERVHLDTPVGCSPGALRPLLERLETAVLQTATRWEDEAATTQAVRAMIGGVDETFLAHLMLVWQDVPTGYILLEHVLEHVAPDRTFATWKTCVDERLKALGTTVK